jgi:amino acid adenylation domain-containing protein
LDPEYPEARLSLIADGGGLNLILAEEATAERLGFFRGKVLLLEDPWTDPDRGLSSRRPSLPNPERLAYITFTSGSTGEPKGVEVTELGVRNFLSSMERLPGFGPRDRLLAVTTLSFDISVLELFLPLRAGGVLVVADEEAAKDGSRLEDLLERESISLMQATPATWRLLAQSGWKGTAGLRALVGGEAFPPDLAEELLGRCEEVWNMYGPTETTVWSTLHKVEGVAGVVPIGRPIDNTRVYVLDRHLRPVPTGVIGELFIGGLGVARGYRERDDLTDDRFLADPFARSPGARMYRTGDRGRVRNDGALEYLGRLDHQIKIRGFRIELGEIEAALSEHPDIESAVVQPTGEGLNKRLVTYAVFQAGRSLTSTEVRRFLQDRLPPYMIPGLLIELDRLPLTPNGKVDRKALPDPLGGRGQRTIQREPPRTPEEKVIGEVWRDLLGIESVNRTDNFYELGGHSLLSMQVVSAVQKKTGKRISPRSMFFQTLEQLATTLSEEQRPEP